MGISSPVGRLAWPCALVGCAVFLTSLHLAMTWPWYLATPTKLINFEAAEPFQHRLLVPMIVAGVQALAPLGAELLFAFVEVLAWMALVMVAHWALSAFEIGGSELFRRTLAFTIVIPMVLHLIVPDPILSPLFNLDGSVLELGTWRAQWLYHYAYDLPAAVFTLGLVLLMVQLARTLAWRWLAVYLGLFALATVNRETTLFLIPAFMAVFYRTLDRKVLGMALVLQVTTFVVIQGTLQWVFADNVNPYATVPGTHYEDHLLRNLSLFANPLYLLIYLVQFSAGFYLPVLLLRHHLDPVLGRTLLWFGIPFLASAFLFGRVQEHRVVIELVPLLWLGGVQAIAAWNASRAHSGSRSMLNPLNDPGRLRVSTGAQHALWHSRHRDRHGSHLPASQAAAASGGFNKPSHQIRAETVIEKIGTALFVLMIAFLAFVGGAMVILGQTFPYEFLRNAYWAGEALIIQRQIINDPVRANLWQPARMGARGVTVYDPSRASPGYTLYTSGDDNAARLITMDGRVVHEWRRPFSTVWHDQAAVSSPQPDNLIYMDKARVLPNGDLLAIYISSADTPWGYGIAKIDKDSNLIWRYLASVHHNFDFASDNRIYVLTHAFSFEKPAQAPQLSRPYLEDFLVVLTPDGEEVKKISLTDAVLESPYGSLFRILPFFSLSDPLHTNTVEYIDAAKARNFPFGEEGDALVSFRDLALVAVVSVRTGAIRWATRGPWVGQHDPSLLPNGDILLFDNLGGFRGTNSSQLTQFDPRTLTVTWGYAGDKDHPFYSELRSSAERLANGNTLINESDGGRLFEVTRSGDIVWEYINPVRRGDNEELIAIVSSGQRIDPATFDPEFRKMLERQEQASR